MWLAYGILCANIVIGSIMDIKDARFSLRSTVLAFVILQFCSLQPYLQLGHVCQVQPVGGHCSAHALKLMFHAFLILLWLFFASYHRLFLVYEFFVALFFIIGMEVLKNLFR